MTHTREQTLRYLWGHVARFEMARDMMGDTPAPDWDGFSETLTATRSDGTVVGLRIGWLDGDHRATVLSVKLAGGGSIEISDPIPADVLALAKGGAA